MLIKTIPWDPQSRRFQNQLWLNTHLSRNLMTEHVNTIIKQIGKITKINIDNN